MAAAKSNGSRCKSTLVCWISTAICPRRRTRRPSATAPRRARPIPLPRCRTIRSILRASRRPRLGILGGFGATFSGNTAHNNGGGGIFPAPGSTISGNTVYNNGGGGIVAGDRSTVIGNTAVQNGGAGIRADDECMVQWNTVWQNTGFGLNFNFPGTAYRENVINDNTAGTVSGGINLFNNSCNGTTTCP